MTTPLALLVLAGPLTFGAVAIVAAVKPGPQPILVARLGTLASWFGVLVAAAAGTLTAMDGLIESPTLGWMGLGLSVRLDALSAVMLGMIALLAVVIFRFSCTYLEGDVRHGTFLGRLAGTIAAVEVLVLSGNLACLIVVWVLTSLALHQLLLFYPTRRGAIVAAKKKFVAARIGDAFLIAAAALLYHRFGTGNLQRLFEDAPAAARTGWALGSVELAALCIVIAAVLKSAQFPTHGWLVEVMETPTPVSALLHAGILNAGPFLIIRMAFVVNNAAIATTLLMVIGGCTALFASTVLLTQPSVKVSLGYSSAAHMGFMLMVCGMGVFPAALLHLVAHSFYKAHAFLSSGSAIDEARASKVALPRRLGNAGRIAASAAIALGLYLLLALLWGTDLVGHPIVLAIGAILVMGTTQIIAPALDSAGNLFTTARTAMFALGVTAAFFALEGGAHHLLYDTVPGDAERGGLQLALIAVILAAFGAAVLLQILEPARPKSQRRRNLAVHLRNGLYANALFDRAVGALRTSPAHTERAR